MHIQGDRWLPDETPFSVDTPHLWGDWYCDSEVSTLRCFDASSRTRTGFDIPH